MTALAKQKRPPRFTAYKEVQVDIDPADLERAGWVYVGKGDETPADLATSAEQVEAKVRNWHDDEHDGPWRWCTHVLCDDVRGRWGI